MKILKYILSAIVLIAAVWSCTEEELGTTDFVSKVVAPTEVAALYNVTQDNTGLVTIAPSSQGAVTYTIDLGDGSDAVSLKQGESVQNIFAEGEYVISITAIGVTGLKTVVTQPLAVSFNAPGNLEVVIANDEAVSKQVNVTATADDAISFDVDFGDGSELVEANIGDAASHVYADAGLYTIIVNAMGAAIETSSYTEVDFEVTAILQPLSAAPTPSYRNGVDVISIFSSAYTDVEGTDYFPDWGQAGQGSGWSMFDLSGDDMLQYVNLSYQGIALAEGTSVDVSTMEYIHLDVWTADAVTDLEVSLINDAGGVASEAPVTVSLTANDWTSIEIPMSDYTDQGLSVDGIFQLKLVGTPWAAGTVFVDNIYFYKQPTTVAAGIVGTWKLAPIAGALKVGPNPNDGSWWSNAIEDVTGRDCLFDDAFVFGSDGTFENILGGNTWIEGWQGGSDSCGTPVAPHDGSNAATFVYDETAGKLTLNGLGAYLGIAKPYDGGELTSPADAPAAINYDITLSNNDSAMTVIVNIGSGYWTYELVKDGAPAYSPLEGTWVVAPEAGSLGVGPGQGDISWWAIDGAGVTQRACFFDDTFVFSADGTFMNVLGSDTWIEGWQSGVDDACGSPVAPHDGITSATFVYDEAAGKVTLNGTGAYLGIPKPFNEGELTTPLDAPSSITYDVILSNNDTEMIVDIWVGGDAWWRYKLVKQGTSTGGGTGGSTGSYDLSLPIDFESAGYGADWTWNVFENDSNAPLEFVANPSASGINTSSTVAKLTALQAGQPWVGTETAHGEMGITWDLSASNSSIKIMVYKTVISDVGIKLVNPAGGGQVEIKVANTVINEWEELTFDFSSRIGNGLDGSTNIDQIVVFPDFDSGGRTQDNVVYFDNITFQ